MSSPTPHDAVFKVFLNDPDTARDFLSIHLPESLQKLCDLSTLRLEPGSYIDKDLRPYYSDVVYSVGTACGHTGYIYATVEHQSTPDKSIAFRLMRYALAIMQNHLRQGHDRLPLVIPLLFYHGVISPYPYSMNWLDLFDEPTVAAALYRQAFPLVDVTVIPDEAILQQKRIAMLELVLKHARFRDLMELADPMVFLLRLGLCTHEQLVCLLSYMAEVGDTINPQGLVDKLAKGSHGYKEAVMTLAQKLEKIGEKRGLEEGRQEGRQEEKREVARKMLMNGISPALIIQVTGLTEEELEKLKH